MRAVPFVFLLFPVYGLDRVGEVITYNKMNYFLSLSSEIQVLCVEGKSWIGD